MLASLGWQFRVWQFTDLTLPIQVCPRRIFPDLGIDAGEIDPRRSGRRGISRSRPWPNILAFNGVIRTRRALPRSSGLIAG